MVILKTSNCFVFFFFLAGRWNTWAEVLIGNQANFEHMWIFFGDQLLGVGNWSSSISFMVTIGQTVWSSSIDLKCRGGIPFPTRIQFFTKLKVYTVPCHWNSHSIKKRMRFGFKSCGITYTFRFMKIELSTMKLSHTMSKANGEDRSGCTLTTLCASSWIV